MIGVGRMTDECQHIEVEFLRVVIVGQELPSQRYPGCLYAEYRNHVLYLRGRGDGQDIEKKEECEDGHQKDPVPEKEHDQAQKQGKSHIKTQNTVASSFVGTKGCFPQIQQLRILHTSFLLK